MTGAARKVNIFLLLGFSACQQPEVPVVELDPIVAQVDTVAVYLWHNRWQCEGDGCADESAVRRIAGQIRAVSDRHKLPVSTMVGVLMVENPWLDTLAVSYAGAIGLYQVMPMHRSAWLCKGSMESVSGSVCRGGAILADMIQRHGSERAGLLGYNGCRSAYCQDYHGKVAERSEQFLNIE
jgi:hypothetical protein